jgi:hypothetical protein
VSHIVTVRTEVRDPLALAAACRRLGLDPPAVGTARLYDGAAEGHLVRLPGWRYPVVFDLAAGRARYDHFGGRWGDPARLDRLLQLYAVEKARAEARRRGHRVTERPLLDGSIKLVIHAGGGPGAGGGAA